MFTTAQSQSLHQSSRRSATPVLSPLSSPLNNKIVLITGCSSGIGEACARIFAEHGANVMLCARRAERLEKLRLDLQQKYSVKIHCLKLDVCDKCAVKDTINNLPPAWQNIDVLVNNAGLAAGFDKFQDAEISDWEQMVDTNVKGLLYITRAAINGMIARNSGHIINIGSVAGHDIYPRGSVYAATKHAVNAITRSLRLDLCGTKLRVTSVDPGMVDTEFSEVRFKGDKERAKSVYAGMTPLDVADVADAVYYCASRPPHVNISELVVFPIDQAGITTVHRQTIDN